MTGDATGGGPRLDEVARRANVPIGFVRRLVSLGALSEDLSIAVRRELGRVRLLYAWSQAGFPPETIMRLVDKKALSITFLDAPPSGDPHGSIAPTRTSPRSAVFPS